MWYEHNISVRLSLCQDQHCTIPPFHHMPMQFVELRLRGCTDFIDRDSQRLIPRNPSTLIAESMLPFDLRKPFFAKFMLSGFLSSYFNPNGFSDAIFNEISDFANQLSNGNLDLNFHIIVDIDVVSIFWTYDNPIDPMLYINDDSSSPFANNDGASLAAIERLMNHKFDGEVGDTEEICTVCSDKLIDDADKRDLSRIPCGHVYHQSCIVRWLTMKNSCPLCRARLQD